MSSSPNSAPIIPKVDGEDYTEDEGKMGMQIPRRTGEGGPFTFCAGSCRFWELGYEIPIQAVTQLQGRTGHEQIPISSRRTSSIPKRWLGGVELEQIEPVAYCPDGRRDFPPCGSRWGWMNMATVLPCSKKSLRPVPASTRFAVPQKKEARAVVSVGGR